MTSRLQACYLLVQRAAERHPRIALAIFAFVFLSATSGLTKLHLDMSFRPLFASGAEITKPTAEFEDVFGQSSGAWIFAILESDGQASPFLLRTIARLSNLVEDIPYVSEVLSLSSVQIPDWHQNRLTVMSPIPEHLYAYEEEKLLTARFETLFFRALSIWTFG